MRPLRVLGTSTRPVSTRLMSDVRGAEKRTPPWKLPTVEVVATPACERLPNPRMPTTGIGPYDLNVIPETIDWMSAGVFILATCSPVRSVRDEKRSVGIANIILSLLNASCGHAKANHKNERYRIMRVPSI